MSSGLPVVCHVIHSGGFYGAERMLADHCLALAGQIDARIVLVSPPPGLAGRFEALGIRTLACHSAGELAQLTAEGCDVLNAHNFRAQVFAWLAARRNGLPLVFTQHGFTPRSLKQHLYTRASLLLCHTPTVRNVACVAQSVAQWHRDFWVPARKLQVLPNGLPHRACLPRNPDEVLIGFVGRLSQEKGPELFLQAMAPLLQNNPQWQAVYIGEGPMQDSLQAEATALGVAGQLRFAGYQQDMQLWLARLSVLVMSSRTEGTPMVLLEAMQAGIPVAAFAVGGIPDVIENGIHGLLAEPLDVAGLGKCINRLLHEPQLADRLAAAARERQQTDYSLEQQAQRWYRLYMDSMGAPATC